MRVLAFLALRYHFRILGPVLAVLQDRGAQVSYFTAAAEAAFEITPQQEKLPYVHALDYYGEVGDQIEESYRALQPVWLDRVLSNKVLRYVPLPIQDKVIRSSVENVFCFDRMLEEKKPDVVFALHEINSWGKILGYLCHKRGIPYITFQEGLCYSLVPLYQLYTEYSTACIVWGEADKEVLLKAKNDPARIFTLGSVDLFAAKKRTTTPEAIAKTREELRIPAGFKVVVFLMAFGRYHTFDPSYILYWLKYRRDVVAIFKFHPALSKDVVAKVVEDFKKAQYTIITQDYDTYALLGIANVCVLVGNSTTGIEALAYGKPLVEVPLDEATYSYAAHGVVEHVTSLEDAGAAVDKILSHGISKQRKQKVREYLARHFTYQDDKTAVRVADLVEEILRGRQNSQGVSIGASA